MYFFFEKVVGEKTKILFTVGKISFFPTTFKKKYLLKLLSIEFSNENIILNVISMYLEKLVPFRWPLANLR